MAFVTCADCNRFIKDLIGDGQGIGECKAYNYWVAKGESNSELKNRLIELGNSPDKPFFWGGKLKDRNCKRFKQIEGD